MSEKGENVRKRRRNCKESAKKSLTSRKLYKDVLEQFPI